MGNPLIPSGIVPTNSSKQHDPVIKAEPADRQYVVTHSGTQSAAKNRRILLWIALLAIALRCVHVFQTSEVPLVKHLIGDAEAYFAWASRIAGGDWLGNESFYQAPLYPYVMAVAFKVFGVSVGVARVIGIGFAATGCLLLGWGVSRILGRRVGFIAAGMMACYAPAIFFDGIVQKASLAGMLVCGLVGVMVWAREQGGVLRKLAVGLVCGLLVLTRENALVWTPVLCVWVWIDTGSWSVRGRNVAMYLLGVGLVLGPVALRNRLVGGDWSVSTFQAGPNFYIGNHQGASGRYEPLVRGHETPAFERADATQLAQRASGRTLSPHEVSQYWQDRAMADIRDDPVWWFGLLGRKFLMVWNAYEVSDAESQYVYAAHSFVLRGLGAVWHFGILCPLAVVGAIATRRLWRHLWVFYAMIGSMAIAVALFYVMARYRYPLVPLLIPFAAAGADAVWRCWTERLHRRLGLYGLAALLVACVVNVRVYEEDRLDALAWMNVGVSVAEQGDVAGATVYFRRAVDAHPSSGEANLNLAQSLAIQGDYTAAIPHYRAALLARSTLPGAEYNLAVALERVERVDEAWDHYVRALAEDASDEDAKRAIERLKRTRPSDK